MADAVADVEDGVVVVAVVVVVVAVVVRDVDVVVVVVIEGPSGDDVLSSKVQFSCTRGRKMQKIVRLYGCL